jgi:hypothetical protein
VRTEAGGHVFLVPRHFVALHGLSTDQLPELAERYGWEHWPTPR